LDARNKGLGNVTAALEGGAAAAISIAGLASPVDNAINATHAMVKALLPQDSKAVGLVGLVAHATPSETIKAVAFGTIETGSALVGGDKAALEAHHDQNLTGKNGEVLQGFAIAFDALGAFVTGDDRALGQLSDAASSGRLGLAAEAGDAFGDWLGKALNPR
jgi:gamma-glutamyl phosphate reductase